MNFIFIVIITICIQSIVIVYCTIYYLFPQIKTFNYLLNLFERNAYCILK